jgi:Spy/CpxP family protein refolding chaperone
MLRLPLLALLGALTVLSADGLVGQEKKKDDPKLTKKDDPPGKIKGMLPQNYGKLGLSDDQKQQVYRIQAKYKAELDQLEAKIQEVKNTRDKELKSVLTAEQKKRLEEILLGKDK